jgi:hypothetical protein
MRLDSVVDPDSGSMFPAHIQYVKTIPVTASWNQVLALNLVPRSLTGKCFLNTWPV